MMGSNSAFIMVPVTPRNCSKHVAKPERMNGMREKLDSKLLLDMMLEIREKSKGNQSIEGKHVIREFVQRLQPFYGQVQAYPPGKRDPKMYMVRDLVHDGP